MYNNKLEELIQSSKRHNTRRRSNMRQWGRAGEDNNKIQQPHGFWCQSQIQRREVGSVRSRVFPPLSLWEKRGSGHAGIPLNTGKGRVVVELVVGCIFFLSPAFPLTPHCLAALKSTPSLSQEVLVKCVCVWKVLGGGFYWNRTEWNLSHCLSSCTPPPRCLTRCLPPSFSTDKECPECLASPAVSDN